MCIRDRSQTELAELVGVSRNTISSIETGQFNPTAKLALVLCIALDKKFEELLDVYKRQDVYDQTACKRSGRECLYRDHGVQ